MGDFEETFLALPKEVLVMVMRHQRYFPVENADGSLNTSSPTAGVRRRRRQARQRSCASSALRGCQVFYESDLKKHWLSLNRSSAGSRSNKSSGTCWTRRVASRRWWRTSPRRSVSARRRRYCRDRRGLGACGFGDVDGDGAHRLGGDDGSTLRAAGGITVGCERSHLRARLCLEALATSSPPHCPGSPSR